MRPSIVPPHILALHTSLPLAPSPVESRVPGHILKVRVVRDKQRQGKRGNKEAHIILDPLQTTRQTFGAYGQHQNESRQPLKTSENENRFPVKKIWRVDQTVDMTPPPPTPDDQSVHRRSVHSWTCLAVPQPQQFRIQWLICFNHLVLHPTPLHANLNAQAKSEES